MIKHIFVLWILSFLLYLSKCLRCFFLLCHFSVGVYKTCYDLHLGMFKSIFCIVWIDWHRFIIIVCTFPWYILMTLCIFISVSHFRFFCIFFLLQEKHKAPIISFSFLPSYQILKPEHYHSQIYEYNEKEFTFKKK